jgi:hypothetical protein
LVNKEHGEKGDKWSTVRLQVDGRWEEFLGREVSQIVVRSYPSVGETMDQFFTLYKTPDEGYKVYVVESLTNAPDDIRRPGQSAAEIAVTRALYSEEAVQLDYPNILEKLLERKQVNRELGR